MIPTTFSGVSAVVLGEGDSEGRGELLLVEAGEFFTM